MFQIFSRNLEHILRIQAKFVKILLISEFWGTE